MQVKLISITDQPEKIIAYIARVSNPNNQDNPDYAKLIKFLIKNRHYSPFEHAFMTVEIKTSRAIAAQILRHRSFTFQEFSQRYSEIADFEQIELRRQATKNRQSSLEVFDPQIDALAGEYFRTSRNANSAIEYHVKQAETLYKQLLRAGVAKEVARMILPLSTQTTLYMTGSVRSWIHYIDLRTKDDVQKEHRLVAVAIKDIFTEQLPTVADALAQLQKEQEDKEYLWKLLKSDGYVNVDDFKKERNL